MSENITISLGDVISIQGQYLDTMQQNLLNNFSSQEEKSEETEELRNSNEILYIVYNPQISNIKLNQSTSINSALGSKFPFYRKNGIIHYKTFQLSGLLTFESQWEERVTWEEQENDWKIETLRKSHWLKEDFLTDDEKEQLNQELTEYEQNNRDLRNAAIDAKFAYVIESRFRDKVFSFLGDGHPKVLESEQEGKMLVVITDLSLAPMKELGRLYSTISMTITEISNPSEPNFDLLLEQYNLTTEPQIIINELDLE